MPRSAVTATELAAAKGTRPITMLTAYDATFARIFDEAGVDMILVGDSVGMVVQGHDNTLPVTLDHMIYHSQCVSRGLKRAHLTVDLPFMTYQVSPAQALESAGRLVKEGGAHSVKVEGGEDIAPAVRAIVTAGIPVVGHVGLTPQSVHALGGFKVQGRQEFQARRILADAQALEEAGCFAIVLEGIPTELAARITRRLSIPTIGIGAGADCDGQVLVGYDLLGMNENFRPRFVKQYATLHDTIRVAAQDYCREVRARSFPGEEHVFHSAPGPVPISRVAGGYGAE